ncbi:lipopolysaccharide export system permease protein [Lutibacter oricola]|uniref:Lipopolysaccharide export system permease protein n=1 Tax=Lutibacter oricola TaxID=762486 RepID=A0A1H3AF11_9FLAO|nr:LptF/LptG family permease [Lutibacter oricola]SDX28302.1 lipopolysaccharide export system permease protein [Lutibacter oricola]
MRILDKYILKKYLSTFLLILVLLLPIAIAINVSEKIDKFLRHSHLSVGEIIEDYYVNFVIIFGNTFMPLALFIAVIFFTSKLASNTEIIAIHSAKISFTRFLKPYFIGATIVTIFALVMNHFVVPRSNKVFDEFERTYLKKKKFKDDNLRNVNLQLGENDYIFFKSYSVKNNIGYDFSYEKFDGNKLTHKLMANNIRWIEKDTVFKLTNIRKRILLNNRDSIVTIRSLDTLFNFTPKDLVNVDYLAKEMNSIELSQFISKSRARGISNLNTYLVELYKRTSLPISSYILTLIAVALASRKKRGGMGVNLAIGITLMFVYVFFLKIAEVLGAGAETNALFMVWFPNLVFGSLAIYLYLKNVNS